VLYAISLVKCLSQIIELCSFSKGRVSYYQFFRDHSPPVWWSNRQWAREKNVGWRIAYQVITPGLTDKIRAAAIYRDQRFSDPAPLMMDTDDEL